MSYDLGIGVKVADMEDRHVEITAPEYSDVTYNVAKILRASTGWNYKQREWYRVSDVLPNIKKGIDELIRRPEDYRHLEIGNGYGKVETALGALQSLLECIYDTSNDYSLSYDAMYVRW